MERIAIPQPPIELGASNDPRAIREWVRKVAQATRQILQVRPTGVPIANSPAQITGNQDNYAHGQVDVLRVDTSGAVTFSGFDAQGFRRFWLLNAGTTSFDIGHQDTNSDTTNRVISKTGAAVAVAAAASALLWYDEDSTRWRILGE